MTCSWDIYLYLRILSNGSGNSGRGDIWTSRIRCSSYQYAWRASPSSTTFVVC